MDIKLDEVKIEKAIQSEKDRVTKLKIKTEKELKKVESKISKVWSQKEEAMKELKEKLADIRKPYDDKIAKLEKIRERIDDKKSSYDEDFQKAEMKVRLRLSKNLDGFLDENAFKGFLSKHDIFSRTVKQVKKPLKNGVVLYRQYDGYSASVSLGVSYFAVKGKRIIGFMLTKKSEHAGDTANYWCWVNKKQLTGKNCLHSLTFKTWVKKVESLKNFVSIDLNNKFNRSVLREVWYYRYDFFNRKK